MNTSIPLAITVASRRFTLFVTPCKGGARLAGYGTRTFCATVFASLADISLALESMSLREAASAQAFGYSTASHKFREDRARFFAQAANDVQTSALARDIFI